MRKLLNNPKTIFRVHAVQRMFERHIFMYCLSGLEFDVTRLV